MSRDARFEVLQLLDRGSMGEVFVARERDLRRRVALKRLTAGGDGAASAERFLREIRITAQLEHPNIVPIYAYDESDADHPAFSMKLIEGETLAAFLARAARLAERDEPLPEELQLGARLEHFLKVCDAVSYAHDKGVIHRDLKPANIMLGEHGEVYVMDWGIARRVQEDDVRPAGGGGPVSGGGTHAGAAIGTPHYMSPEQARAEDLDARSDQYALGLILYEIVALRRAIRPEDGREALLAAMDGDLAPLRQVGSRPVPPEPAAIVHKATEMHRAYRYPSVEAMAEDVRRYRNGEPILARPDTPLQAVLRWIGRHRGRTLTVLLLLVAVFFASMSWSLHRRSLEREAAQAREAAVSRLLTAAAKQGHRVDELLLRYEGLLEGLAAGAAQALAGPLPEETPEIFTDEDFADPGRAPADHAEAPRYGMSLSTTRPVFVLAPGVAREVVEPTMRRMAGIGPSMRRIQLRSQDEEAAFFDEDAVRERIAVRGVPLVWTYVASEEGVHLAFPGKAGYPEDYDPRARPWYRMSAREQGPRWGTPYLDALGQGLLLPCTTSMFGPRGEFLGVAGVEVTFRYLKEELLDLPELDEDEALIADELGRVVVSTGASEPRSVKGDSALRLPLLEAPELVRRIGEREAGGRVALPGGRVAVFFRMEALGWYYVVLGREDALVVPG